jgi:hypothetical protein
MKKYVGIFGAAFIALATMSFTIAGNNGSFGNKMKQSNNCFNASDYSSTAICEGTSLPSSTTVKPLQPTPCAFAVTGPIFPSTYDDLQSNCTGTVTACCFTVSSSTTCGGNPSCYSINDIWFLTTPH